MLLLLLARGAIETFIISSKMGGERGEDFSVEVAEMVLTALGALAAKTDPASLAALANAAVVATSDGDVIMLIGVDES